MGQTGAMLSPVHVNKYNSDSDSDESSFLRFSLCLTAGRVITAAYIPEENYVDLFPDAKAVVTALKPSRG